MLNGVCFPSHFFKWRTKQFVELLPVSHTDSTTCIFLMLARIPPLNVSNNSKAFYYLEILLLLIALSPDKYITQFGVYLDNMY